MIAQRPLDSTVSAARHLAASTGATPERSGTNVCEPVSRQSTITASVGSSGWSNTSPTNRPGMAAASVAGMAGVEIQSRSAEQCHGSAPLPRRPRSTPPRQSIEQLSGGHPRSRSGIPAATDPPATRSRPSVGVQRPRWRDAGRVTVFILGGMEAAQIRPAPQAPGVEDNVGQKIAEGEAAVSRPVAS